MLTVISQKPGSGGFNLTCFHHPRGREKSVVDRTLVPKASTKKWLMSPHSAVLTKADPMVTSAISTLARKGNESPKHSYALPQLLKELLLSFKAITAMNSTIVEPSPLNLKDNPWSLIWPGSQHFVPLPRDVCVGIWSLCQRKKGRFSSRTLSFLCVSKWASRNGWSPMWRWDIWYLSQPATSLSSRKAGTLSIFLINGYSVPGTLCNSYSNDNS